MVQVKVVLANPAQAYPTFHAFQEYLYCTVIHTVCD